MGGHKDAEVPGLASMKSLRDGVLRVIPALLCDFIVLRLVNSATKARGPLAPHAEAGLDRFWVL